MPLVTIVPFENIEKEVIDRVKDAIINTFNSRVNVYPRKLNLPHHLRKRNGQLNAEDFLPVINKLVEDYGVGIVDHDLFVPGLNFVFGVAFGKNCVIALARLKGDRFLERVRKEAIHELGHCFGLSHCAKAECVMHFSNSLVDTDYKGEELCRDCKEGLG